MPDRFTWSVVVLKKEILITLEASEQWFEELIWSVWAVLSVHYFCVIKNRTAIFIWTLMVWYLNTCFLPLFELISLLRMSRREEQNEYYQKKFFTLCHSVCFLHFRF